MALFSNYHVYSCGVLASGKHFASAGQSKLANILVAKELAKRYGLPLINISPGQPCPATTPSLLTSTYVFDSVMWG